MQNTGSNMAASEILIRDGSISVLFMSDVREVVGDRLKKRERKIRGKNGKEGLVIGY